MLVSQIGTGVLYVLIGPFVLGDFEVILSRLLETKFLKGWEKGSGAKPPVRGGDLRIS
jgi:hypothetical protein